MGVGSRHRPHRGWKPVAASVTRPRMSLVLQPFLPFPRLLGFASVPSCVDASVPAVHPTCVAKGLTECRETFSTLLITFRVRHEEAQSAHAVQWLTHRREGHEGCQPPRDDLPPSHWITSAANRREATPITLSESRTAK